MIYEWKAPDGQRNFGDETFDLAKSMQKVPVYIGCGWNGKKASPEKMSQALFWFSR
jgi:hypothetical protein